MTKNEYIPLERYTLELKREYVDEAGIGHLMFDPLYVSAIYQFGCGCPVVDIVKRMMTQMEQEVPEEMYQSQPESKKRQQMLMGYPLEYLVVFAEACRRAGVDESNLKTFANNCTFAYATMAEEYRQQINQVIDAFMGNAGGTNASD